MRCLDVTTRPGYLVLFFVNVLRQQTSLISTHHHRLGLGRSRVFSPIIGLEPRLALGAPLVAFEPCLFMSGCW